MHAACKHISHWSKLPWAKVPISQKLCRRGAKLAKYLLICSISLCAGARDVINRVLKFTWITFYQQREAKLFEQIVWAACREQHSHVCEREREIKNKKIHHINLASFSPQAPAAATPRYLPKTNKRLLRTHTRYKSTIMPIKRRTVK